MNVRFEVGEYVEFNIASIKQSVMKVVGHMNNDCYTAVVDQIGGKIRFFDTDCLRRAHPTAAIVNAFESTKDRLIQYVALPSTVSIETAKRMIEDIIEINKLAPKPTDVNYQLFDLSSKTTLQDLV